MEFLEDIKKGRSNGFSRELRTNKRIKEVCNIDNAKSVGNTYGRQQKDKLMK